MWFFHCDSFFFVHLSICYFFFFFFFKQKTAYEMRISDWSSDVCSSDLRAPQQVRIVRHAAQPCQFVGDQRRLIETARPQPPAVQRHRNQQRLALRIHRHLPPAARPHHNPLTPPSTHHRNRPPGHHTRPYSASHTHPPPQQPPPTHTYS